MFADRGRLCELSSVDCYKYKSLPRFSRDQRDEKHYHIGENLGRQLESSPSNKFCR